MIHWETAFFWQALERCLKMVIRSWQGTSHIQMLSSSFKDAEKISLPHFTSLGPFQSCLSFLTVFQLPGTFWPSSKSSRLLPARTGLLFSAVLLLLGRFLWKKPQVVQCVAGTCCRQLLLFLTQRPTGSFQTKILPDAAATTLPQWLFLAERPVLQHVKVL